MSGEAKTKAQPRAGMSSQALLTVPESRRQSEHFVKADELLRSDTGIIGHARVFDWVRVPFKQKSGETSIFDIIDSLHCTRVLIVIVDQKGVERIALVEQDRQKVVNESADPQTWGERVIELPGGAIEREISSAGQIKEEKVITNVLREIMEEVGAKADSAELLYANNPRGNVKDAGFGPGKVYWFIVRGKVIAESTPEQGEGKVRVLTPTIPEALEMINSGEIHDALTIPPILEYALRDQLKKASTNQERWPQWLRVGTQGAASA